MTITAMSIYNTDSLKVFQQVAAKRVNPTYYQGLRIGYLGAGAGALALGVYYAAVLIGGDNDVVTIALAVIGLYLGVQLLRTGIRYYDYFAQRAMKNIPPLALRNYFSFEEEQIVISNQMRSGSYPYSQFGFVCETKDYFLFYINRKNGYVMEKRGIENATADELRELLNSKLADPVVRLEDM